MENIIYKLAQKALDISEKETNARLSFLDRLLTISGVLFGVLVSLYPKEPQSFECRLSFFLGVLSLVLGILMTSIGRYCAVYQLRSLRKRLLDEIENVLKYGRLPGNVFSKSETFFLFCEKMGYVFLLLSLFLFVAYLFFCMFAELQTESMFPYPFH